MKGVAVDIITGFLGSGKTTLIKHVLQHGLHNRRVAVVVNDIGAINLDGRILEGVNVDRMVELSNGCVCCSISYQFGYAIQEIVETTQAELILIETSGAAEPVALIEEMRRLGLRVDGVITVVDGEHIRHLYRDTLVARQQVQAADFLVLNKCDILSLTQCQQVEAFLQRRNPRAFLLRSIFGRVPTDLLFATGVQRFRQQSHETLQGHTEHLQHDDIEAFTYSTTHGLQRQRFLRFVRRLPRHLYRAKGILYFDQDAWSSLFNYTCGRYDLDWFLQRQALQAPSQLVFIGKGVRQQQQRFLEQLRECELATRSGE